MITASLGTFKNPGLRIDGVEDAIREAGFFAQAGGGTLVDAMPVDCGRDPRGLVAVSHRAGVHVVATTGFHTPYYYPDDHWSREYDVETIAELLVAEVVEGMDVGSYGGPVVRRLPARAGLVKIATELHLIGDHTRKLMEAVAECHLRTGVPILTHAESGTMALPQVQLLGSLGVPPSAILISHVDRNHDPGLHRELASCGAFFIYDGPSREHQHSPQQVAKLIEVACAAGGGSRVLLGTDLALRSYRRSLGGRPGLGYLLDTFVPVLLEAGFDEAMIDAFGVGNPARALSLRFRAD